MYKNTTKLSLHALVALMSDLQLHADLPMSENQLMLLTPNFCTYGIASRPQQNASLLPYYQM